MTHVLILGGTAEARELAASLHSQGVHLTSSLAGRVASPRLPVGAVQIGGFGGVEGLSRWLIAHQVTAVVDATHPFAQTMSAHAAQSCSDLQVPMVRLARPGWRDHPDVDTWTWVADYAAAREAADECGGTPFVTTGRQTLHHYRQHWEQRQVVVRLVEPAAQLPPAWTVLRSRGPFEVAAEEALMRQHQVAVLLTKDSGGTYTQSKLTAARRLGVAVVVVARPSTPAAVPEVSDVPSAAAWVTKM